MSLGQGLPPRPSSPLGERMAAGCQWQKVLKNEARRPFPCPSGTCARHTRLPPAFPQLCARRVCKSRFALNRFSRLGPRARRCQKRRQRRRILGFQSLARAVPACPRLAHSFAPGACAKPPRLAGAPRPFFRQIMRCLAAQALAPYRFAHGFSTGLGLGDGDKWSKWNEPGGIVRNRAGISGAPDAGLPTGSQYPALPPGLRRANRPAVRAPWLAKRSRRARLGSTRRGRQISTRSPSCKAAPGAQGRPQMP